MIIAITPAIEPMISAIAPNTVMLRLLAVGMTPY